MRVAYLGAAMAAVLSLPQEVQAEMRPLAFVASEMGATTDPTGLWTDAEIVEGGSDVQPPISYASIPVDGGTLTIARLVDRWCGTQDCPYRFRLETSDGRAYLSHGSGDYGMACGSDQGYAVDPVELVMTACGQEIDLKTAR